jgi:hypothetical protein
MTTTDPAATSAATQKGFDAALASTLAELQAGDVEVFGGANAARLHIARAQVHASVATAMALGDIAAQLGRIADQGDPETAQQLADAFINGQVASDVG